MAAQLDHLDQREEVVASCDIVLSQLCEGTAPRIVWALWAITSHQARVPFPLFSTSPGECYFANY